MRQIVYISTGVGDLREQDVAEILRVSQVNNRRDGITGLLYFDGKRFLQAIEGDDARLESRLKRIRNDSRHRAIVILSDRQVVSREFGTWSMARRRSGEDEAAFIAQVSELVRAASPNVRATFEGLAMVRKAA